MSADTHQTTLQGDDAADNREDDRPVDYDRSGQHDLQGYAYHLFVYGQLHDDPGWSDAARYALDQEGRDE